MRKLRVRILLLAARVLRVPIDVHQTFFMKSTSA